MRKIFTFQLLLIWIPAEFMGCLGDNLWKFGFFYQKLADMVQHKLYDLFMFMLCENITKVNLYSLIRILIVLSLNFMW